MGIKLVAATSAFAALTAPAMAQTTVSLEQSSGSYFFSGPHGNGNTKALRIEGNNGSGLLGLRIGKTTDAVSNTYFDKNVDLLGVANITARANWAMDMDAKFVEVQKSFSIANTLDVAYGVYVGKANGMAEQAAKVNLHTNPFRLDIPSYAWHGLSTPAVHINEPAHDFPLYSERTEARGSSPYGGITLAADLPIQLSARTQLRLSPSGQAGADRIGYGAGAAFVLTSQPMDAKDRQMPDGACNNRPYSPSQGFAFTAAFCAEKTVRSPLYNLEKRKAGEYAGRINGYASRLQGYADQVEARTGYGYKVPTYTAQDVLNGLGLPDPTAKVQTALKLGVSGTYKDVTLGVSGSVPLGGIKNRELSVNLGYRFP